MRRFSSFSAKTAAAVLAAAIGGAALTQLMMAPAAPSADRAGLDIMQRLRDDHAQIADYIDGETQASKLANAAASREVEQMRLAARAAATQPPQRLAQAETAAKRIVATTVKAPVAARAPAKPEPIRVASSTVEAGEPLQLTQMINAGEVQVGRRPLVRAAVGAMRGRLRQFASTVRRVPLWLVSAADWMSDAVPVSRRIEWPGREFRASL